MSASTWPGAGALVDPASSVAVGHDAWASSTVSAPWARAGRGFSSLYLELPRRIEESEASQLPMDDLDLDWRASLWSSSHRRLSKDARASVIPKRGRAEEVGSRIRTIRFDMDASLLEEEEEATNVSLSLEVVLGDHVLATGEASILLGRTAPAGAAVALRCHESSAVRMELRDSSGAEPTHRSVVDAVRVEGSRTGTVALAATVGVTWVVWGEHVPWRGAAPVAPLSLTPGDLLAPGRNDLVIDARRLLAVPTSTLVAAPGSVVPEQAIAPPPSRPAMPLCLASMTVLGAVCNADGTLHSPLRVLGSAAVSRSGSWKGVLTRQVLFALPPTETDDAGRFLTILFVTPPPEDFESRSTPPSSTLPVVSAFAFLPLTRTDRSSLPEASLALRIYPGAPPRLPGGPRGEAVFRPSGPPAEQIDNDLVAFSSESSHESVRLLRSTLAKLGVSAIEPCRPPALFRMFVGSPGASDGMSSLVAKAQRDGCFPSVLVMRVVPQASRVVTQGAVGRLLRDAGSQDGSLPVGSSPIPFPAFPRHASPLVMLLSESSTSLQGDAAALFTLLSSAFHALEHPQGRSDRQCLTSGIEGLHTAYQSPMDAFKARKPLLKLLARLYVRLLVSLGAEPSRPLKRPEALPTRPPSGVLVGGRRHHGEGDSKEDDLHAEYGAWQTRVVLESLLRVVSWLVADDRLCLGQCSDAIDEAVWEFDSEPSGGGAYSGQGCLPPSVMGTVVRLARAVAIQAIRSAQSVQPQLHQSIGPAVSVAGVDAGSPVDPFRPRKRRQDPPRLPPGPRSAPSLEEAAHLTRTWTLIVTSACRRAASHGDLHGEQAGPDALVWRVVEDARATAASPEEAASRSHRAATQRIAEAMKQALADELPTGSIEESAAEEVAACQALSALAACDELASVPSLPPKARTTLASAVVSLGVVAGALLPQDIVAAHTRSALHKLLPNKPSKAPAAPEASSAVSVARRSDPDLPWDVAPASPELAEGSILTKYRKVMGTLTKRTPQMMAPRPADPRPRPSLTKPPPAMSSCWEAAHVVSPALSVTSVAATRRHHEADAANVSVLAAASLGTTVSLTRGLKISSTAADAASSVCPALHACQELAGVARAFAVLYAAPSLEVASACDPSTGLMAGSGKMDDTAVAQHGRLTSTGVTQAAALPEVVALVDSMCHAMAAAAVSDNCQCASELLPALVELTAATTGRYLGCRAAEHAAICMKQDAQEPQPASWGDSPGSCEAAARPVRGGREPSAWELLALVPALSTALSAVVARLEHGIAQMHQDVQDGNLDQLVGRAVGVWSSASSALAVALTRACVALDAGAVEAYRAASLIAHGESGSVPPLPSSTGEALGRLFALESAIPAAARDAVVVSLSSVLLSGALDVAWAPIIASAGKSRREARGAWRKALGLVDPKRLDTHAEAVAEADPALSEKLQSASFDLEAADGWVSWCVTLASIRSGGGCPILVEEAEEAEAGLSEAVGVMPVEGVADALLRAEMSGIVDEALRKSASALPVAALPPSLERGRLSVLAVFRSAISASLEDAMVSLATNTAARDALQRLGDALGPPCKAMGLGEDLPRACHRSLSRAASTHNSPSLPPMFQPCPAHASKARPELTARSALLGLLTVSGVGPTIQPAPPQLGTAGQLLWQAASEGIAAASATSSASVQVGACESVLTHLATLALYRVATARPQGSSSSPLGLSSVGTTALARSCLGVAAAVGRASASLTPESTSTAIGITGAMVAVCASVEAHVRGRFPPRGVAPGRGGCPETAATLVASLLRWTGASLIPPRHSVGLVIHHEDGQDADAPATKSVASLPSHVCLLDPFPLDTAVVTAEACAAALESLNGTSVALDRLRQWSSRLGQQCECVRRALGVVPAGTLGVGTTPFALLRGGDSDEHAPLRCPDGSDPPKYSDLPDLGYVPDSSTVPCGAAEAVRSLAGLACAIAPDASLVLTDLLSRLNGGTHVLGKGSDGSMPLDAGFDDTVACAHSLGLYCATLESLWKQRLWNASVPARELTAALVRVYWAEWQGLGGLTSRPLSKGDTVLAATGATDMMERALASHSVGFCPLGHGPALSASAAWEVVWDPIGSLRAVNMALAAVGVREMPAPKAVAAVSAPDWLHAGDKVLEQLASMEKHFELAINVGRSAGEWDLAQSLAIMWRSLLEREGRVLLAAAERSLETRSGMDVLAASGHRSALHRSEARASNHGSLALRQFGPVGPAAAATAAALTDAQWKSVERLQEWIQAAKDLAEECARGKAKASLMGKGATESLMYAVCFNGMDPQRGVSSEETGPRTEWWVYRLENGECGHNLAATLQAQYPDATVLGPDVPVTLGVVSPPSKPKDAPYIGLHPPDASFVWLGSGARAAATVTEAEWDERGNALVWRTPATASLPTHIHVYPLLSTAQGLQCFVSREGTAKLQGKNPPPAAPALSRRSPPLKVAPRPPPERHPVTTAAAGGSLPLLCSGFDKRRSVDEYLLDASASSVAQVTMSISTGASRDDEWDGASSDLGLSLAFEPSHEALAAGRIVPAEEDGSSAFASGVLTKHQCGRWTGWVDLACAGTILPVHLPAPLPWLTRRARAESVEIHPIPLPIAAAARLEWALRSLVRNLRWVFSSRVASDSRLIGARPDPDQDSSVQLYVKVEGDSDEEDDAEEDMLAMSGGAAPLDMGWDGVLRSGGADAAAKEGGMDGFQVQWRGVPAAYGGDMTPAVAALTGAGPVGVKASDADFDACLAELRESAGLSMAGARPSEIFGIGGSASPTEGGGPSRSGVRKANATQFALNLSRRIRRGESVLSEDDPNIAMASSTMGVLARARGIILKRLVPTMAVVRMSSSTPYEGGSDTPISPALSGIMPMGVDPSWAATAGGAGFASWAHSSFGPAPSYTHVPTGVGAGGGRNGAEDDTDPTADLGDVLRNPLVLPSLLPSSPVSTSNGDEDVVAASGAAASLFAALMEALSPTLSAVGGPGCAQQLLADYAELKRKFVQFTRTTIRQDIIRENRRLRDQGLDTIPLDADAIEQSLPKGIHYQVRKIARLVATLQRIAGEAVRVHRRLCRLEGRVVDELAEAALVSLAANAPGGADVSAVSVFRSGLMTREQRRVLLADAAAHLQAHAVPIPVS
jgi:hypothetical protein